MKAAEICGALSENAHARYKGKLPDQERGTAYNPHDEGRSDGADCMAHRIDSTNNEEETMAYSDYGGYAYRNGKRVEYRSDATITPEGDTYGTPGSYPGFSLLAAGVPHAEVKRRIEWPIGHAVLGDGPVYLVLRKTYATLYRGAEKQELPIDRDDYDAEEVRRAVEFDGYKVELVYTQEDNYYVYARFTQPDGNVWHGWSGYGVGAGLEDCGYGYSTEDREDVLRELWPESIAG